MKKVIAIFAISAVAILTSCGSEATSDSAEKGKTDSSAVETEAVEEAPEEVTVDTTAVLVEDSAEVK